MRHMNDYHASKKLQMRYKAISRVDIERSIFNKLPLGKIDAMENKKVQLNRKFLKCSIK